MSSLRSSKSFQGYGEVFSSKDMRAGSPGISRNSMILTFQLERCYNFIFSPKSWKSDSGSGSRCRNPNTSSFLYFQPTSNIFLPQPPRDHVHLPGAVDMRAGPDLRLVRLARRVPPLERAQEAEALRRALRPHALLLQRHPRLAVLWQGSRVVMWSLHQYIDRAICGWAVHATFPRYCWGADPEVRRSRTLGTRGVVIPLFTGFMLWIRI